jgi:hypothetical protein
MARDPADAGFYVSNPCWLLVHKNSVAPADDGTATLTDRVKWLVMDTDLGTKNVPVFTDEDSAARYREADGLDDAVGIGVANAEELASILCRVADGGHATEVLFDPRKSVGAARNVWPIDYVIDRILKGLSL